MNWDANIQGIDYIITNKTIQMSIRDYNYSSFTNNYNWIKNSTYGKLVLNKKQEIAIARLAISPSHREKKEGKCFGNWALAWIYRYLS